MMYFGCAVISALCFLIVFAIMLPWYISALLGTGLLFALLSFGHAMTLQAENLKKVYTALK